ncbi:MAG: hypothetical protein VX834_13895 [Myxococcota bacterium]|nr:hypothetical protein [Myxococcota bacterium]
MRTLGIVEQAFASAHADVNGAAMPCFVLHLNGPIHFERLEQAFLDTQAHYWTLGQTISRQGGHWRFAPSDHRICGRLVLRENEDTWQSVAEHELNRPIKPDSEALMRFTLLSPAAGEPLNHDLIITTHHAIIDGISFLDLVETMLAAYAGQPRNRAQSSTAPSPPAESLSPVPRGLLKRWLTLLLLSMGEMWKHMRWPPEPVTIAKGDMYRTSTKVISRELPNDLHQAIKSEGRRHDSSFSGALVASSAQAVHETLYPHSRRSMRTSFAVNLRDSLNDPSHAKTFACYVGGIITLIPRINTICWSASSRITKMLRHALREKQPWFALPFLKLNSFFMINAPQVSAAAAHISNLGSQKIETYSDTLRVQGHRTLLAASGVGRSAIVNCNTYPSCSYITLTYSKLHVSEAEAEAMVMRLIDNLHQLAQSP